MTLPSEFHAYLQTIAPDIAELTVRVHALVHSVDPTLIQTWEPGYRTLSFARGPRKMKDGVFWLAPHNAHVNLGCFHGTALADPAGLLEGTGKSLRHVKIRSAVDLARPELLELLTAALRAG
jgi:hypothetical protein